MKDIPFGRPIIEEAERQAVMDVLAGPILVHGPRATQFEEAFAKYTGAPYAVSVSSCTAAMHLYYFHLGLQAGDEVIVPAQTHTATAHAVELCGAKAVFVDAEPETGNIDIAQLEAAITPKTRAIAVVHYLGMPVKMDEVNQLARQYNLKVLEDCALAIGSYLEQTHAGLLGDIGCFSFYPVKHMTTAEGGMIITKDKELADQLRLKKAFGVDRHMGQRKVPGVYDVTLLGLNYRMNEIQAAIGIEQVKKMDDFLRCRKDNYWTLHQALEHTPGITLLKSTHDQFQSSYYCLSVLLDKPLAEQRTEIINSLKAQKIGTSIYYPKPVPHMTYYRQKYGYSESSYPVAAWLSNQSIALPVGPHLEPEDMLLIADQVKQEISRRL